MRIGLTTLPDGINRQLITDDDTQHFNPIQYQPETAESLAPETIQSFINVKVIPTETMVNAPILKTYHIKVVDCLGKNITNDYVITDDQAREFLYPSNDEFLINELFGKTIFIGKADQDISDAKKIILSNDENIIIRNLDKCLLLTFVFLIFLLWPKKK